MRGRRERGEQRTHVKTVKIEHLVYTFCESTRYAPVWPRISLNRTRRGGQGTRSGVSERHGVVENRRFENGEILDSFFRVLTCVSRARPLGQVPKRRAIGMISSHRKVDMNESEVVDTLFC
jgi:hypothetical protein